LNQNNPTAVRNSVTAVFDTYLTDRERSGLKACATRLYETLNDCRRGLGGSTVLVAFGGGKDSAYMLAFVRRIQLELDRVHGTTFTLRVATMRHAGMAHSVIENIDRSYRALGLYDDPECEMYLVDGGTLAPFALDVPQPVEERARNRRDVLMSGHRTHADGRPTFCNACNLSVAEAFYAAADANGGVEVIVTGDSPDEQRAYALWVHRLAYRFGLEPSRSSDFRGLLETLRDVGLAYFREMYVDDRGSDEQGRGHTGNLSDLCFFSIYDETDYASGDHWRLLTELLGFNFDESAFNFTESDCGNPALMAHLRGLKAERLHRRSYSAGLQEYVNFALDLMRAKDIPEILVAAMEARYSGPGASERARSRANRYAKEVFSLYEDHLVCMVHSPFAAQGQGLNRFLEQEHPDLVSRIDEFRAALGSTGPDISLAPLQTVSGLSIDDLRTLYRGPLWGSSAGSSEARTGLLPAILEGDPHKTVVEIRNSDGQVLAERMSGR
jgi:hypothetical protein